MGKVKELQERREKTKVDAVLDILRKQSPLSLKQVYQSITLPHSFIQFTFLWFYGAILMDYFVLVWTKTKQEKFCNTACVERFLRAKGESVKKAAKQLRACLTWRDTIGVGIFSISLSS